MATKAQKQPLPSAARPRYIVAFPAEMPFDSSVRAMAEVKGAREFSAGGGAARVSFAVPGAMGAKTAVFDQIGVATADLSLDEVDKLKSQGAIVVPNQMRSIPPIPRREIVETPAPKKKPAKKTAARAVAVARTAPVSWCLSLVGISAKTKISGKGVRVAVLDTGLDLAHPDFKRRVPPVKFTRSFVKNEKVTDLNGHGTHCAGIVGGPRDTAGIYRYGVAPDCELVIGKVMSNSGSGYDDDIMNGMQWAVENGARVISMSLGSERSVAEEYSAAYERVAKRLLAVNVLVFAAAGNASDRDNDQIAPVENPAACPSIYAVSAVDRRRDIAWFSCGQLDYAVVDLTAPGVAVYSSYTRGRFAKLDGTSMATPHVAGMAALFIEANPGASGAEILQAMTAGAEKMAPASDYGNGLIRVP